jgi:hypothetical protein
VTKERLRTRRHQGGDQSAVFAERLGRDDGIHAAVETMEPARPQRAIDRGRADSELDKLLPADRSALIGGDRPNLVQ